MGRLSINRSFGSNGDHLEYIYHVEPSRSQQRRSHSCSPDHEELKGSIVEDRESNQRDARLAQVDYPIVSRQMPDSDLPFIVAKEVAKHSGTDGTKLCLSAPPLRYLH